MRPEGRRNDELRPTRVTRDFIRNVAGSVMIESGHTKVICTASIEEKVPAFLRNQGQGWLTAEYGMIPRSTYVRHNREGRVGKLGGRTQEIQRLIGRSLRSVIDLKELGEKTITIDCDVIQADGGTRTASITGAFICLIDLLRYAMRNGIIEKTPIRDYLAAVSVGIVNGEPRLDLCYEEDSAADVDMNVVMTDSNKIVEIQGTAEGAPYSRQDVNDLLDLAEKGIRELIIMQKKVLESEADFSY